MLSAMQAIAKITTSEADVMVSPSASNMEGSTSRAIAAASSGIGRRFHMLAASLEPRDALAEQAARPEQQHEQHQEIDRGGGGGRIADPDHDAFDETDQKRCRHHAPERSEPADHHHDESRRDDLLAH